MRYYDERDNLIMAEKAMRDVTKRFNEQLNRFDIQTLNAANLLYKYRKNRTKYYIDKKNPTEQEFKWEFSEKVKEKLNINCSPEKVDFLIAMSSEKARPVLKFIEQYKKELQKTYMKYCSVLRCAINKGGLDHINATQNRENQYYNELVNGVFASSGFSDLENYIGRAATKGYGMTVNNSVVVYPDNPFKEIEEQKDANGLLLKKDVFVYSMDASKFEPVVDFELGRDGLYNLQFGQEWISKNKRLECEQERIDRVPREMLERKQVFYKKQRISSEELSFYSEKEFPDKYSKLIASGKLGYINGEFKTNNKITGDKLKSVLESVVEAIVTDCIREEKVDEQSNTMIKIQQEKSNSLEKDRSNR